MQSIEPRVQSDRSVETVRLTEIAGEATVESAPAERDSSELENGLEANEENGIELPGPVHQIDVPPTPDAAI